MKTTYTAFHCVEDVGAGPNRWGVKSADAVLYEPLFTEKVARRLAQLESRKTPPVDWEAARAILEAEGFSPEDLT